MTKKILIVEDDTRLSNLIEETLQALDDIEARVFASGDATMNLLLTGEYRPDLAILDYELAGSQISGEELCVILRNSFPTLPIIMLSGRMDPQDISDVLRACGSTFIQKPYSPRDLLGRIEKLLKIS